MQSIFTLSFCLATIIIFMASTVDICLLPGRQGEDEASTCITSLTVCLCLLPRAGPSVQSIHPFKNPSIYLQPSVVRALALAALLLPAKWGGPIRKAIMNYHPRGERWRVLTFLCPVRRTYERTDDTDMTVQSGKRWIVFLVGLTLHSFIIGWVLWPLRTAAAESNWHTRRWSGGGVTRLYSSLHHPSFPEKKSNCPSNLFLTGH